MCYLQDHCQHNNKIVEEIDSTSSMRELVKPGGYLYRKGSPLHVHSLESIRKPPFLLFI